MSEREPKRKPDNFDTLMMRIREHTKVIAVGIVAGVSVAILGDKTDIELLHQAGSVVAGLSTATLTVSWAPMMVGDMLHDTKEIVAKQVEKIGKNKK